MQLQTLTLSLFLTGSLVSALPARPEKVTGYNITPGTCTNGDCTDVIPPIGKREPQPAKPEKVKVGITPGTCANGDCTDVIPPIGKREPEPAKPIKVWYYGTAWGSCHGEDCTITNPVKRADFHAALEAAAEERV